MQHKCNRKLMGKKGKKISCPPDCQKKKFLMTSNHPPTPSKVKWSAPNAKQRRQRRRTVKNNNRSNQQKANLHVQHTFFCTFLCCCFVRLQRETFRNFLVTHFMEEMSHVFLFTFFSLRSFSPSLVAVSISHFVTDATKFSFCSSNKRMSPLFFSGAQGAAPHSQGNVIIYPSEKIW